MGIHKGIPSALRPKTASGSQTAASSATSCGKVQATFIARFAGPRFVARTGRCSAESHRELCPSSLHRGGCSGLGVCSSFGLPS